MKRKEDIYSKPKKLVSEYLTVIFAALLATAFLAIEIYSFAFTESSDDHSQLQVKETHKCEVNTTDSILKSEILVEPKQDVLIKTALVQDTPPNDFESAEAANPLAQVLMTVDESESWKLQTSFSAYSLADQQKLLNHAIENNHAENLIRMLDAGFSLGTAYYMGDANQLIFTRKYQVVMVLIKRGLIDVNKTNKFGYSLLHEASAKGHGPLIRLIVSKGVDVNSQANDGASALHYPSRMGYGITVSTLLELGINPNLQATLVYPGLSWQESTPLHIATKRGHVKIVKKLLGAGADRDINDANGMTALDIAKDKGDTEIITLLESKLREEDGEKVDDNSTSKRKNIMPESTVNNDGVSAKGNVSKILEDNTSVDKIIDSSDINSSINISDGNTRADTL